LGSGITALNADNIASGTINNARLPSAISVGSYEGAGSNIQFINATNISSGTLDNARLPSAISVTSLEGLGSGITALNADNIASGTINNARLPSAISVTSLEGSGASITALDATNIASGTLDNARLPSDITISGTLTTANLNVSGTTTTVNTATYETENIEIISTNADGPSLKITHDTVNYDIIQVIDNSSAHALTLTYDGKLGIGTSAPNGYISLVKTHSSATSITVFDARFDANWGLKLNQNYVGSGDINYSFVHTYNTNDYNLLTFMGANVGIGTNAPGYKLHVVGDINFTGTLYQNGINFTGGGGGGDTTTLSIARGGTGATTQEQARTNLGVDQAGTDNSTDVTLTSVANNYLTISGQAITAGTVPVSLGGTGASNAADARANLGVDEAGKDNSTNVTLASVPDNYLSIDENNQVITAGQVPISLGGTGASTQGTAAINILPLVTTGNYLKFDGTNWVGSEVQVSGGKWKLIGDTDYSYYSSNVKIGGDEEVTPVAKLEVNGDIVATGDMTAGYSDDRLKDYISNIENPIDIIKSLNGYYFKPNELANSLGYTNREKEVGVSAQEVNSVLPEIVKLAPFDSMRNLDNELVSKSGSNYLTVNYEKMAPLFIEAIKALNDKIDSMTTELNSLKEFKKSVLNQQNF